ncbi:MAG: TerB family tellurite resistance protein [Myxococcales bacterium]|nr:TerB family tellurite resistance protein [Myxococcales bacterium]
MELTYDLIAPLVAQEDVSGRTVSVIFQCPVSGRQVRSSAQVVEDRGKAIGKEMKRSLWRNLRWSMMSTMRSMFGYGLAGHVGAAVADTALSSQDYRHYQPSEAEVKQATVDAFVNVQQQFAWDASGQRFVSAQVFRELQTEFATLVQSQPLDKPWDKNILARMLAEVAAADGHVEDSERDFFHGIMGGEGPSLDELVRKPRLTAAELEETSPEVRKVMLLVTTAVAMSDEEYSVAEREHLTRLCQGLGLQSADLAKAEQLAADYLVDQALEAAYGDGQLDSAERLKVDVLAAKLHVAPERVQRLDARCRKRKGLL